MLLSTQFEGMHPRRLRACRAGKHTLLGVLSLGRLAHGIQGACWQVQTTQVRPRSLLASSSSVGRPRRVIPNDTHARQAWWPSAPGCPASSPARGPVPAPVPGPDRRPRRQRSYVTAPLTPSCRWGPGQTLEGGHRLCCRAWLGYKTYLPA